MNIRPKKSLGQNFLINIGVAKKIIDAAEINDSDVVIEVGPGKGILTELLAARAGEVIAIEKDHRLIPELTERFKNYRNLKIVEYDILEFSPSSIIHTPYKIVANLPYYITSHFLKTVFDPAGSKDTADRHPSADGKGRASSGASNWPRPKLLVLMVQEEVAKRIVAGPPDMSILALSVQYFSEPEIVMRVSRGSFRPEPNVDSAVIKLTPRPGAKHDPEFFKIIHAGFASKRKTLLNNLSTIFDKKAIIEACHSLGISENIRAENLSLNQWLELKNSLGNSTQ